jgi:Na+/melibiose symporter-like transporter
MQATISPAQPTVSRPPDMRLLVVEFVSSAAANFLQTGIFFYTRHRFHWTLRANFLLAATQGAFYVIGAMNANRLTRLWTRRQALARTYAVMAVIGLIGVMLPYSLALAILLPLYSAVAAMSWPMLESLVSEGHESGTLSRKIAIYNVIWAAAGALVLALNGTIIEHFAGGVFAIPAILHGLDCIFTDLMSQSPVETAQFHRHLSSHRTNSLVKIDYTQS